MEEKTITIYKVKFKENFVEIYSSAGAVKNGLPDALVKPFDLWESAKAAGFTEEEIYNHGFAGRQVHISSSSIWFVKMREDEQKTKDGKQMSNENEIEQEIKFKNLNAPRITPEMIDSVIDSETYTVLPSGKVMICELTLLNGFVVTGEAAVVSKENFNEEIGRKVSRENARNKIWMLEGYLLQDKLYQYDKAVSEMENAG